MAGKKYIHPQLGEITEDEAQGHAAYENLSIEDYMAKFNVTFKEEEEEEEEVKKVETPHNWEFGTGEVDEVVEVDQHALWLEGKNELAIAQGDTQRYRAEEKIGKAWAAMNDQDININIPGTYLELGEADFLQYLEKEYKWLNARGNGFLGNSIMVEIDGENLEIDLSPSFKNQQKAIDVVEKIIKFDKEITQEAIVDNTSSSIFFNLGSDPDTSAANMALDGMYTISDNAETDQTGQLLYNIVDTEGNEVEGLEAVNHEEITTWVRDLDDESQEKILQNGFDAAQALASKKTQLLDRERYKIKNNEEITLSYYQNSFQANLTEQIKANLKLSDEAWEETGYGDVLDTAFGNVKKKNNKTIQKESSSGFQTTSWSTSKTTTDKLNEYNKDIFSGVEGELREEIERVLDIRTKDGENYSEFLNEGLLRTREQALNNRKQSVVDRYIGSLDPGEQQLIELGQKVAGQKEDKFRIDISSKAKKADEVYKKMYANWGDEVQGVLNDLSQRVPDADISVESLNGDIVLSVDTPGTPTKEQKEYIKLANTAVWAAQNKFNNVSDDYRLTVKNMTEDISTYAKNNIYNESDLKSSVKEYGHIALLAKDVNDAVKNLALTVPTILNADWAVRHQKKLNKKSEFYEAMPEYQDDFWKYGTRSFFQQSGNLALMAATGGAGTAFTWSTAAIKGAMSTVIGVSSGAQTYRDLKSTQQLAGTADKQEALARAAYKDNKIDLYDYTLIMRDINTSKAMLEISDSQIIGAAVSNGVIEGTFMQIASAGNMLKVMDDFASPTKIFVDAFANEGKGILGKFRGMITKPLAGVKTVASRVAPEVFEEVAIFSASQLVTEAGILDREVDFTGIDDVVLSTIITAGTMQGAGTAYSGIMTYGATDDFKANIKKLRIFTDELSVSLQGKNLSELQIKNLVTDIAENLKEQGLELDRLAVDVLSKGSDHLKRLISTEIVRSQILEQAGVKPGDSEARKAELIDIHKEKIGKDAAAAFDANLDMANRSIKKLKEVKPNYNKAEKSLGGVWNNTNAELSNEEKYGKGGKDGYKYKSRQDKIVAVINETRKNVIQENIDAAKRDPEFVEWMERNHTQTDKNTKGRKWKNEKEKNDVYERVGRNMALKSSKAFSTALSIDRKVSDIFPDLKNIQSKEYKAGDEQGIRKLLDDAGLVFGTKDYTESFDLLMSGGTHGLIVNGNTIISQDAKGATEDFKNGIVRAGTVVLHEFDHMEDDARIKTPESKKMYADNLFKAAATSDNKALKQGHDIVVDQLNRTPTLAGMTFEKDEKYRDEYTKYLREYMWAYESDIKLEKDDNFVTRIFNGSDPANLNTPEKALQYVAAKNSLFRKGKITKASQKAINEADTKGVSPSEKTTVNELAIKYQEGTISDNDLFPFVDQYQNLVLSAMGYNIGKGDIPADNAIGFANGEFASIMKNYKPIDKNGKKQAFTTYVNGVMRLGRGNKFYKQELEPSQNQVRIGEGMDFAGGTSAESNLTMEERQAREDKEVVIKIDPRKFRVAEPKIKAIEAAVDITVTGDIAPFKADFKAISTKYGTKVASIMYDITEGKLQKNANLTYAKKISKEGIPEDSEAGRIQNDFDTKNDQEVKRFLKLLPPENVTSKEAEVGTQGEKVIVSRDVQGRSLGLSNKVLDFFYDGKTTERSSGLTSQPYIRKLKSKFGVKANITNATIKELQNAMGITPAGQLNKYDRNIGTFLAGVAKLKGAIVTSTVAVQKVSEMDTSKSSRPKKQILADMSAGRSVVQFSEKEATVASKEIINNIVKEVKEGSVKFSTKLAENTSLTTEFLKVIKKSSYKDMLRVELLSGVSNPVETSLKKYLKAIDFGGGKNKLITDISKFLGDNKINKNFKHQALKSVDKAIDDVIYSFDEGIYSGYGQIDALEGIKVPFNLKDLGNVQVARAAALWLKENLGEDKFVRGWFQGVAGPAKLMGFELDKDPAGIFVEESEVKRRPVGKQARMGSFNSVQDGLTQLRIKSVKGKYRNANQTRKNWWTSDKFNKLDDAGKIAFVKKLYDSAQIDKAILVESVKLIRKGYVNGDIPALGVRHLIVGQFADMAGVGKAAAGPRMIPYINGKLATHEDLFKAGLSFENDVYVLEHMIPAKRISLLSYNYAITGNVDILNQLELELKNYDTAILPKKLDDQLKQERGTQEMMGIDYRSDSSVVDTRYAGLGIQFLDVTTGKVVGSKNRGLLVNETNIAKDNIADKAMANARDSKKYSEKVRKARVFDFDDTLAQTKSNILFTMPDGTKGKLDAATFAKDAGKMEAEGVVWDFSEFSKVMEGKKGPLFDVAKKIQSVRGSEDIFVLTARPQDAAGPIKEFLASLGLNIPLKNITGLANGDPKAKADWLVNKFSEGYNDFYFADDHLGNVNAAKEAFKGIDVKSKVQQAKVKFSMKTKQKLDWVEEEGGIESTFEVNGKEFKIEMQPNGMMEFPTKVYVDLDVIFEKNNLDEDDHAHNYEDSLHVEFSDTESGTGITNKGDAFEVLSVSANGIVDFVKNNKVETDDGMGNVNSIIFTAKEASRIRLYNAMSIVMADKLGWNVDYKNGVYLLWKPTETGNFNNQNTESQAVLNVLDVKSNVQQNRVKFSEKMSDEFNSMIERNKGVNAHATFSDVAARRKGLNQKRYSFWIPPSADDFRGLTMYTFAGKGKQGEADQAFFDKALIKPYTRGVNALSKAKQNIKNDYSALIKTYPKVKKKLRKKIGDTKYTNDAAVRIYLWTKAGETIPGLSKGDQKKVVKLVSEDSELVDFAAGVKLITRLDEFVAPGDFWDASTILGDLNRVGRDVNRKEFLREFTRNVDEIFSKENLNKVQAIYGFRVRESLEEIIGRMKSGSNASKSPGRIVQKWNEWVNNSVGAIMFFNRRSALLQMLSTANFVNWSDNNPAKAALAFANQPQFWKDWIMLFNSPKLKQRRSGLEGDIQEAEIAQASKKGGMAGVISYILKLGFTPTQIADSIAIASGGAAFYRNRVKTYEKQGFEKAAAEAKAFEDFSDISDETQQSADPMLISSQQSSVLGRLVLAFQNTTMQYARLMKKAGQDLINGRGSKKENITKILYYGFLQNMIFNGLQNAFFALIPGFDDEEEDDGTWETDKQRKKEEYKKQRLEETKIARMVNGMVDSVVKGTGLAGAVAVTLKNTIREYIEYHEKPDFAKEKGDIILAALQISPPIGSKAAKINTFLNAERYEKDVVAERGFDVMIDGRFQLSPAYKMVGSLTAATINLPLDRAVDEINAITEAFDTRNSQWQRLALALGWRNWDAGVRIEEHDAIKTKAKQERKKQGKVKAAETRKENKEKNKEYRKYRLRILRSIPTPAKLKIEAQEKESEILIPAYKLQKLEEKYLDLK